MKNGIKYLVAGLVATGVAVSSYATITVNYQANQSSFITDSTGPANYLNGDLVEIGSFSVAPTVGSASLANFSVFSSTTSATGAFTGSGTGADTGFAHDQIYLVIFNQATSTVGPNTQEAIVDVSDLSNSSWKFPASADTITATTFDLNTLFATPGSSATLATGAQVVFGSVGVDTIPADGGPFSLVMTAPVVPEPSTYLLVGTGLLGLLGLRRRRS